MRTLEDKVLQKIFGYKVELVEHSVEYTLVKAQKSAKVGSQIPVRVSGGNGERTPAIPMSVVSCRACEYGGFLITGRFLVDHPDLSGFAIPPSLGCESVLRADPRMSCHLCVISRDLPGYRVMTIDLSEGGLQVEAPARVALGNSVLLSLEFGREEIPILRATATVSWCRKTPEGAYRIGLQFKALDKESLQGIRAYQNLLSCRDKDSTSKDIVGKEHGGVALRLREDFSHPTHLSWHDVPLFSDPTLVAYRRADDRLRVRLRGGKTGVRYREYEFRDLRGMQDYVEGELCESKIEAFRLAETTDDYYRFQFLDSEGQILLELEAKSCSESSSEQN